jgi:hypothetical protein
MEYQNCELLNIDVTSYFSKNSFIKKLWLRLLTVINCGAYIRFFFNNSSTTFKEKAKFDKSFIYPFSSLCRKYLFGVVLTIYIIFGLSHVNIPKLF